VRVLLLGNQFIHPRLVAVVPARSGGLMWDWRGAFVVSGALGVIGMLLAWAALPR
jgi:predicted MFS family arabinose efflux permease